MKKLFVALLLVNGCTHINSVSLTPIPSQRSQPVRAEVSRTIFLGFNFDNDYIDPLVDDLKRQCPNGVVSGILTKDQTTSYLIVFTKRVIATGYCNNARSANAGPRANRRQPSSVESTVNSESAMDVAPEIN